jgi:hypothetical protein
MRQDITNGSIHPTPEEGIDQEQDEGLPKSLLKKQHDPKEPDNKRQ